ncbi:hypothetical protein CL617_04935 [archaeon]|nr:hypothetical protein [archaeon]|tara:strand:- start:688 stop:963 length:276 start_codon:yes stop_codon:yes gene_type:complete
MLNITSNMLPEQVLEQAHTVVAVPQLILLYLVFSLIFLIIGLFSINANTGNHPYRKFMVIWGVSVVVAGLFLIFLVYSPHSTNAFIEWIRG